MDAKGRVERDRRFLEMAESGESQGAIAIHFDVARMTVLRGIKRARARREAASEPALAKQPVR